MSASKLWLLENKKNINLYKNFSNKNLTNLNCTSMSVLCDIVHIGFEDRTPVNQKAQACVNIQRYYTFNELKASTQRELS